MINIYKVYYYSFTIVCEVYEYKRMFMVYIHVFMNIFKVYDTQHEYRVFKYSWIFMRSMNIHHEYLWGLLGQNIHLIYEKEAH